MSVGPFIRVAIDVPLSRLFDYLPPADAETLPPVGSRVRVPFGRRQETGVVLGHADSTTLPADKIRSASSVLDDRALLSAADLELIRFASDYYHHPIGEVVATALPGPMRHGKPLDLVVETVMTTSLTETVDVTALAKRAPKQAQLLETLLDAGGDGVAADLLTETLPNWRRIAKALFEKGLLERAERRSADFDESTCTETREGPTLNSQQQAALSTLRRSAGFGVFLLDGVTGSGKTEVYLQRTRDLIETDKQVLLLVPEIGLTPQLAAHLRRRLGVEPALLHSGLSATARLAAWRAARSGTARLILGTRSAIFAPMRRPGLIIVDEEHDQSFKQQEGLRYSARDLAIARAKQVDVPVILGSATPTLEVLQHCRAGSYQRLLLPARAGGARPPTMKIVDTARHPATDGISEPLAKTVARHIDDGGQALIYLNRRGFAPTLICTACGHIAGCDRCDSRLTVHARNRELRCHHCGSRRPLTERCDACGETVKPLGEGTERVEDALIRRFPRHTVRRIDSDSIRRKGAMDEALRSAAAGDVQILVGTQMLSKGHHFPDLTLVGVVNADQGLFGTDFRSAERMAQSIVQVAGRAGRETRPGEVLIQSAFPDHPFWETLIDSGYARIVDEALAEREQTHWPPFTRLALLRAAAHRKIDAHGLLELVRKRITGRTSNALRTLGPVEAPLAKKAGRHRAQLLLQSEDRSVLHAVLRDVRLFLEAEPTARRVRWSIDVDPIELF